MSYTPIPKHPYDRDCPRLATPEGCYYCCERCNYDRHLCPGCGDNLPHTVGVCDDCAARWDES